MKTNKIKTKYNQKLSKLAILRHQRKKQKQNQANRRLLIRLSKRWSIWFKKWYLRSKFSINRKM